MRAPRQTIQVFCALLLCLWLNAATVQGQEQLCDNAHQDCRLQLWKLIDRETKGIDVAFWFMQDASYATKLINRFKAGVPVRVLMETEANQLYPGNEQVLAALQEAGIPMRERTGDGILHWKMMQFAGQGKVQFSGGDYSPNFFVATTPFENYIDEAIYFTDDASIVNSFKTKFDDLWTDTKNFSDYANITGQPQRAYPSHPIDAALNFGPGPADGSDYLSRSLFHLNEETQQIDIIMYRITDVRYSFALSDAIRRGVTVRLLTEQDEYRNRSRPLDAYNIDLLYSRGVQIRLRAHQGLMHEKAVLLRGQGMTIFGSSNWSGPSANFQEEHNYFSTKPWMQDWFSNQFERKWQSSVETKPFTPLPADKPAYVYPVNQATEQPTIVHLMWEGGPWAHKYDIYFGHEPNPPLLAANQVLGLSFNDFAPAERRTEVFLLQRLEPGTKYYWRIVSKTMAGLSTPGQTFSFTTTDKAEPNSAPIVRSVLLGSSRTEGGTTVRVIGANFLSGATVSFGGVAGRAPLVLNGNVIKVTTPKHPTGAVDITVTNPDGQSATLVGGFSFTDSKLVLSGDLQLDGVVDAADLALLGFIVHDALAAPAIDVRRFDLNLDGIVDRNDIAILSDYLVDNLMTLPARVSAKP